MNSMIYYTGIDGNNMHKFIYYQILANILILKLKSNENISVLFPIDILLMVMKSAIFVWHPGPYTNLNDPSEWCSETIQVAGPN